MKVAITGAAGHIGSLLVRAHSLRGDEVHASARQASQVQALPGVARYGADIRIPKALGEEFFRNADVVYHCAGEVLRESLMHSVNVDGTRALLAQAKGLIGHWVQLSSLSVYGNPRDGVVDESSPVHPRSTYGKSKRDADALLEEIARDSFSFTLVRPSSVIGPSMRNRSMYALIDAVARKRFCYIGRPGAIGNYVHEDNAVDMLMLCAMRPEARNRTYILSQTCAMEELIGTLSSAIGCERRPPRIPETLARLAALGSLVTPALPLTPARVDALTSRVEYRGSLIERELGYQPRKSVPDAMRELVAVWKASGR